MGALFNRSAGVKNADRVLASQALGTFLRYSFGGGNNIVNAPVNFRTYRAALGVGLAFTVISTYKQSY